MNELEAVKLAAKNQHLIGQPISQRYPYFMIDEVNVKKIELADHSMIYEVVCVSHINGNEWWDFLENYINRYNTTP